MPRFVVEYEIIARGRRTVVADDSIAATDIVEATDPVVLLEGIVPSELCVVGIDEESAENSAPDLYIVKEEGS